VLGRTPTNPHLGGAASLLHQMDSKSFFIFILLVVSDRGYIAVVFWVSCFLFSFVKFLFDHKKERKKERKKDTTRHNHTPKVQITRMQPLV